MCRLFGFRSAIQSQVHHSLVHADNALLRQSEKHPDGWGVAYYQADVPHIIKSENSASFDGHYRRVSAAVTSSTVLAHIRKATAGEPSLVNSHPFQYGRWVFAHNGKIANFAAIKPQLFARIDPKLRVHILGDTDSECIFYLILTHLSRRVDLHLKATRLHDISAAVQSAIREICELTGGMSQHDSEHSTFLTFILTDGTHVLAHQGGKELHVMASIAGQANHIILASEPLQGDNAWQPLGFGELLGIDANLRLHRYSDFRPELARIHIA